MAVFRPWTSLTNIVNHPSIKVGDVKSHSWSCSCPMNTLTHISGAFQLSAAVPRVATWQRDAVSFSIIHWSLWNAHKPEDVTESWPECVTGIPPPNKLLPHSPLSQKTYLRITSPPSRYISRWFRDINRAAVLQRREPVSPVTAERASTSCECSVSFFKVSYRSVWQLLIRVSFFYFCRNYY